MLRRFRLKRLTLRQKLFYGFGFNILIILALVVFNTIIIKGMTVSVRTIEGEAFPQAVASLQLESAIHHMVNGIETSIETGNQNFLDEAKLVYEQSNQHLSELVSLLEKNPETLPDVENLVSGVTILFNLGSDLFQSSVSFQEWESYLQLDEKYKAHRAGLLGRISELREDGIQKLNVAISDIRDRSSFASRLILILGLVAVAVGIFVVTTISLTIMKPIRNLVQIMKQAEHGDFTGRYDNPHLVACWEELNCDKPECPAYKADDLRCWQITGTLCDHGFDNQAADTIEKEKLCESCSVYLKAAGDEFSTIGQAFNNMIAGLVNLLTLVRKAASDVMIASKNLFSLSEDLRAGSDKQANSVDEVTSSIEEMNNTIRNVADNVENYYRTAEESNTSILQMTASIEEVAHNAEELTNTVEKTGSLLDELTASIRQVAQHTGSLSDQVEQSSAALMQIDSSVKEVADGAKDSSELASLVTDRLMKEGSTAVSNAADSIVHVRDIVTDAAEVMRNLAERSGDIGKILQVIDELSDQTRLLSLNAAILAAQAGSEGRAFSVVAEEIRDLSDRTSSSTNEINQLLSSIPLEVGKVMEAIQKGTEKVDEGVKLITEVKEAINVVSEAAQKSAEASSMIMTATGEQVSGIRQAAELEQNIAVMSKEIADAMKYQAENCEKIVSSAQQMKTLSLHVKRATEEQASGTKLIGHASSESMKMARNITEATKEEAKGSELIVQSIESVSTATSKNMEIFSQLGEMVASLTEHSRLLQEEMERFKVDGGQHGESTES